MVEHFSSMRESLNFITCAASKTKNQKIYASCEKKINDEKITCKYHANWFYRQYGYRKKNSIIIIIFTITVIMIGGRDSNSFRKETCI